MDTVHVVILALLQGLTEFLPISSSAHLILPSQLLGWPDQGIEFDVAVHVGTLLAVMIYFRNDIWALLQGWFGQFGAKGASHESRLSWYIIVATIPVGLIGFTFEAFISAHLRSALVIALSSIFFGLLLWFADSREQRNKQLQDMTLFLALMIGIAQAFALIPGTSRSGVTMTMALLLGFSRVDAAKFSFLISIPVIISSGLFEGIKLASFESLDWQGILLGVVISGVSAYLCIHFFLSFISRISMLPFVVYRVLLGLMLIGLVAAGSIS